MKCLLLTRYSRLGASSRLRFSQFVPRLRQEGIEIHQQALLDDAYLQNLYGGARTDWLTLGRLYLTRISALLRAGAYDVLWIEKELFPMLPSWGEGLLRRLGVPYLVDYDDATFHSYDLHANRLVRRMLGRKIDHVMRNAALVVAGNDYLAERAERAGAKWVEIFPTVVDVNRYVCPSTADTRCFTVGWIGSPATTRYLQLVAGALERLNQHGRTRLVAVGAGAIGAMPVEVISRLWSEDTEGDEIGRFDVGIMPLEDGPWERGKCGYKLIQYMASCKAVVASPVGVNREIVQEGVNGFTANSEEEWLRALTTLREDPVLRERMGAAGRRMVEDRYSTAVAVPRLVAWLRQCARR